ncbi:zinc dependent phospholipase C family protein [Flavihumibacter sp. ZG627]|uniref:zinc dependent phospholipase C family protein n=1 Tax=Flavihumibacter sp. ZG627 TaxID=1463156 RepID=UPI0005834346|nr:zinc dependent phospholipase C family protein [Flavihumibacter sp. ZG627]KIC89734.1 S1/P1 Nuclease [Flavihumibacter sp. ZG627]
MIRILLLVALLLPVKELYCWGFFGHKRINEYAIYLLPPEMLVLFKPRLEYLREHAVDADKRRYILKAEAPRHYIDLDKYGEWPFNELPRKWEEAVAKYSEDSLQAHGILPWRILQLTSSLTKAFRNAETNNILRIAADLGHYIGDAHVPLHTSSNHNGQHTNQHGIHAFWESRLPELLADNEWDLFTGKAIYIEKPAEFIWRCVLESADAVDSVLRMEAQLSATISPDKKYAWEWRNQLVIRQYSTFYSRRYDAVLRGMVERRMRQAIHAVASIWYTAWVNAGQPDLKKLNSLITPGMYPAVDSLEQQWRHQPIKGKSCD